MLGKCPIIPATPLDGELLIEGWETTLEQHLQLQSQSRTGSPLLKSAPIHLLLKSHSTMCTERRRSPGGTQRNKR